MSGDGLSTYGGRVRTLFRYVPGQAGYTFTRSDATTCATYIDSSGILHTVAANVLRDAHYIGGVRTTLLEGSRTNLALNNRNLAGAAWTGLTGGTAAQTATGIDNVANSASAYTEDASNGQHNINQPVTLSASTTYTATWDLKGVGRTWVALVVNDKAGTQQGAYFNLSGAGTVGNAVGTPTSTSITALTGTNAGWYRCSVTFASSTGASSTFLWIYAASANGTVSYVGNSSVAYNADFVGLEVGSFASSRVATTSASVTRAADVGPTFPYLPIPQATTLYVSWLATFGAGSGANSPMVIVGNNAKAGNYYDIWQNNNLGTGGGTRGQHSANVTSALGNAANLYDAIESMLQVDASGNATAIQSLLGAAQTSTTATVGPANEAAFTSPIISFNSLAATDGQTLIRKVVVAAGVQTLATMRTL